MKPSSRLQLLHAVLLLFAVATAAVPFRAPQAQGDASAMFADGSAAFERGDFATALRYFRLAREAGADGPAIDYNIAVCEYRLGRLDEAERSFRQLGAEYPQMAGLADYNVGLVLFARGEIASARRLFETVRDADDPTLRDLATAALGRIAPPAQRDRSGWASYIEVNGGYDGNVALIEDSVLPAGRENGSNFVEAIGFARRNAGAENRWRVDLTGYVVRYSDVSEYDQIGISAAALRAFTLDAWTVRAGPIVGVSRLDGDGFDRRAGVQLAAERYLAENGTIRLRTESTSVDAIDDRFGYVEGDRRFVDMTWVRPIGENRLFLSFGLETNDRLGDGVSPDRERVAVTYRFPLASAWLLDAGAMLRDSDYDDLATPRSERLRELSIVARRPVGGRWEFSTAARLADNDSTDPLFDYSRTRVSVGVNRIF